MINSRTILTAIAVLVMAAAGAAEYGSSTIAPPFNGQTPASEDGALVLPFKIEKSSDRWYWDLQLDDGIGRDTTSIEIEAALAAEGPVRGMTLHLRYGGKWGSDAEVALPVSHRRRLTVPLARFVADPSDLVGIRPDALRVSLWSVDGEPVSGTLKIYAVRAKRDVIAIATMPDDSVGALVRCRRLFDSAGIPYAEIGGNLENASFFDLVVLPSVPVALGGEALGNMKVASDKGTAFMVFYTASDEVSSVTGIKPGKWAGSQPWEPWTAFVSDERSPTAVPTRVPHETTNLLAPLDGENATALAWWVDSIGRTTTMPACVANSKGVWFAHLPPLPTPPAGEFMRSICQRFSPGLVEVFAVNALMENDAVLWAHPSPAPRIVENIKRAVRDRTQIHSIPKWCGDLRTASARQLLATNTPPRRELRAAWDPNAQYRAISEWSKLLGKMDKRGLNTIFALMHSGGYKLFGGGDRRYGVDLQRLVAKCDESSIKLHAWIICLSAGSLDKGELTRLESDGRLLIAPDGKVRPWLCPANPKNLQELADSAVDLVNGGVDGIHLDYIRYPDPQICICRESRLAFERRRRDKVSDWPADVLDGGVLAVEYRAFQRDQLTEFVRRIALVVRAANPEVEVSAAVFGEVTSAAALYQEWPKWVRDGTVDFVAPMSYLDDLDAFKTQLARAVEACGGKADAIVPGIGTTTENAGPDVLRAVEQVLECRKMGARGFSFFFLDDYFVNGILGSVNFAVRETTAPAE